MKHDIIAEGFGVRLRPVCTPDASFIVWLRNLEHVKGKVGDSAVDAAGQEKWLETYYRRPGDYYFIVETLSGTPLGTHSIYDVAGGSGEMGRWIIRPGVQAAVPSHMVAIGLGFDRLGLRELRNTIVSTNQPVLSISRKFGFQDVKIERGERIIGGKPVDIVHLVLTAEAWTQTRERWVPIARLAEGLVREWEQAQFAPAATFVPEVSPALVKPD